MGPQVSTQALTEVDDSIGWSDGKPNVQEKYFGVSLPVDLQHSWPPIDSLVFTDKSEALKVVKKHKRARFKAFSTEAEAIQFVVMGSTCTSKTEMTSSLVMEKLSPFKGPKPQEFVVLRKCIERGDFVTVKQMVDENPRYLVSSGDTPAILQEGPRYNSLHIAAKSCNASLCCYILNTISSPAFIRKLYGDSNDSLIETTERCEVLLDLYLNTPDKGLNETPLHFASKMGAVDVVEILVSYSQCDKWGKNKFGNTPSDVNCSRASGSNVNNKDAIADLLTEQYYVPVLRSEDSSVQAVIGEPFLFCSNPELKSDGVESKMEVRAVAGPMLQETAIAFRKKWKTPPRSKSVGRLTTIRRTLCDPDKGLESIGRELAYKEKISWSEYWPFLDLFIDLSSEDGLALLEEYLRKRFKENYSDSAVNESQLLKLSDSRELSHNSLDKSNHSVSPVYESNFDYQNLLFCNGSTPKRNQLPTAEESNKSNEAVQLKNMDKMCQVYVRRLADAVLKGSSSTIAKEVKHIQKFLENCQGDVRFRHIPMNRVHSRIAGMCRNRLESKFDFMLASDNLENILGKELRLDDKHSPQYICILTAVQRLLKMGTVHEDDLMESSWMLEKTCTCKLQTNPKVRRSTRRLFSQNDESRCEGESDFNEINLSGGSASNGNELYISSDESSSDEYFTPPSSPPSSPAELDCPSDDEMFLPEEGPEVYIIGNKPSKLDVAVLEAISSVESIQYKYPYINHWKHMCSVATSNKSQDRWPSPSLSELNRTYMNKSEEDILNFTPNWHRLRLLSPEAKLD